MRVLGRVEVDDILEIQQRVLSHRLGVHDFSRDLEKDGYDLLALVERHGLMGLPTSGSTAHVSVVDAAGVVLSTTPDRPAGTAAIAADGGLSSPAFTAIAEVMRAIAQLRAAGVPVIGLIGGRAGAYGGGGLIAGTCSLWSGWTRNTIS